MPDSEPPISRREMLSGRLIGDMARSLARGMGQAHGVVRHLQNMAREDPPEPPMPNLPVLHRPPGACDELSFTANCTKCDACVRACPVDAIIPAPPVFAKAGGTPMIDPRTNACTMCAGHSEDGSLACIAACMDEGSGVLCDALPTRMGTAKVLKPRCLAAAGEDCDACVAACPVDGAISMRVGGPRVEPALCTGCGACLQACPTTPRAIAIIPVRDRPPMVFVPKDNEPRP